MKGLVREGVGYEVECGKLLKSGDWKGIKELVKVRVYIAATYRLPT